MPIQTIVEGLRSPLFQVDVSPIIVHRHPPAEGLIKAAVRLVPDRLESINGLDREGFGYTMRTFRTGVRVQIHA
jgi:hypothetical protein